MKRKIAEAVMTLSLMLTMTGVALYSNNCNSEIETINYDMSVLKPPCVASYAPDTMDISYVEVGLAPIEKDPLVMNIYYELYEDYDLAEEIFYDDLELLNEIVVAEAEGESEYGKRLVIDVVLNRCNDPKWPQTIEDVIFQSGQFESLYNGRYERVEVSEDVAGLILEELGSRSDTEVIYFCSNGYIGTPLFQEDNHYFGK